MRAEPVLPAYDGACVSNLTPALTGVAPRPAWMPDAVRGARSVVLLVLDGLGWEQLEARRHLAPNLAGMDGGAATTVAPTTTATALTSLTTGLAPGEHGVIGYRILVAGQVLNVLRWQTDGSDARGDLPPDEFQPVPPFVGTSPAIVTKVEFGETGFSRAHLRGARLHGYSTPSGLAVETAALVGAGEPFVYAYYDGVDKVSHITGLGAHYDAELRMADHLVGELLDQLPSDVAVVVTADHGQVEVGDRLVAPDDAVLSRVSRQSGEGRFRWLHARSGRSDELLDVCRSLYDDVAWVVTREQTLDEGWFGPKVADRIADLLGDVALVPFAPIAFTEPADTGPYALIGRHGSMTSAEVLVPLIGARGRA